MKKPKCIFVLLVSLWMFLPSRVYPCTTFCLKNGSDFIFGRNYDWEIEYGLIIVNKRGVAKTAMPLGVSEPARWLSKYGSVTFNQYGREFPLGGMNEAGLVVELMWLAQTEYPNADQRGTLIELQWIQYQLDTAGTVDEVISSDKKIRIDAANSNPLHFLICDRRGGVAAIEFLGGLLRVHKGKDLPVAALTNNTYAYCLDLYKRTGGDEKNPAFAQSNNSLKRFVWAAQGVKEWDARPSGSPVAYAFRILDKAAVDRTMFRIVYDVKSGTIHFRTKSTPEIRSFNARRFDFACGSPVKILDILENLKGDVTSRFRDYSREANYDLIKKSFAGTPFLKGTPDDLLRQMARYPDSLECR